MHSVEKCENVKSNDLAFGFRFHYLISRHTPQQKWLPSACLRMSRLRHIVAMTRIHLLQNHEFSVYFSTLRVNCSITHNQQSVYYTRMKRRNERTKRRRKKSYTVLFNCPVSGSESLLNNNQASS